MTPSQQPSSELHGRDTHRSRPPGTKRKLTRPPAAPAESSNPSHNPRQSSISDLFTSTQARTAPDKSPDPPKKRQKAAQSSVNMAMPRARPDVNTSQRQPRSPETPDSSRSVVDLTGAMTPTPPRRPANRPAGRVKGRSINAQPFAGAKKLVIKNLRQTPRSSPEELLSRTWSQLDTALTAIFEGRKISGSLEELYRGVENICRHQGGAKLFERLQARCCEHVVGSIQTQLSHLAAAARNDVEVLSAVQAAWTQWKEQVLMMRSIFYYMDRSYLLLSNAHPTIEEMGTTLFRERVFRHKDLRPRVLQAVCELMNSERDGVHDAGNRAVLKDSIKMSHELLVYETDLEPELHQQSSIYFHYRGERETAKGDLAGYILLCGRLMDEEIARCDEFGLDHATRREFITILEDTLVSYQDKFLVQPAEIHRILDAGAMAPLQTLYRLLQSTERVGSLEEPWSTYIKSAGSAIIDDETREGDMVLRLLDLKTKLDRIWQKAFRKNDRFGYLLREAFATFINERRGRGSSGKAKQAKPGEMIAKYLDYLLRGGVKAIPSRQSTDGAASKIIDDDDDDPDARKMDEEAELIQQLDRVLELFRFIEGKDVFEAFYKKDLARRLLMARSASADAERIMLTKLKNECGAAFTHNLEQMFKDIDLSREELVSYKQQHEERGQSKQLDLSVNVLSSAAWPNYSEVPVTVPKAIMNHIMDYDRYYKSKHSGRKLKWKHQIAHCVVKAYFRGGVKELVVSSFQAIVMLLFNDVNEGGKLSYKQIQASTGLSDQELVRTLQALACARYRILNKDPRGRDVNETDSFSVNANFTDPKYRIKVNQIQLKETKEENKATHEDVNRDRQYEAQAAIVRIMKGRKTITAPELMAETINLTKSRGALDTAEIKKQIDKLIEKDYLERATDDDGRIVYHYLA